MNQNINNIKKQIIYRCSRTGNKETDIIYKKTILRKIDYLSFADLKYLSEILKLLPDSEIFLILTCQIKPHKRFKNLMKKLLDD